MNKTLIIDPKFLEATQNIDRIIKRPTAQELDEKYNFSRPIQDFFKADSFPAFTFKARK